MLSVIRYQNDIRFSSAPPEALAAPTECPGIVVDWPVDTGGFNETFPWSRIGHTPESLPFFVEVHNRGSSVHAWSKNCATEAASNDQPCRQCFKIRARIEELAALAIEARRYTNHRYLNSLQLRALLDDRDLEIQRWKLKVSCPCII